MFLIGGQACAWPFSVFYSKTGFWPSYCQISTDLDKILHTPVVVQNTLVDRLRPRLARGRLQAKPERLCFFVISLLRTLSPIQRRRVATISAANRQSGGEDRCYCEKNPEFCSVCRARSKNSIFRVFRVPFDCPAHSLQETVLPQPNGTDGKPRLRRCAFC